MWYMVPGRTPAISIYFSNLLIFGGQTSSVLLHHESVVRVTGYSETAFICSTSSSLSPSVAFLLVASSSVLFFSCQARYLLVFLFVGSIGCVFGGARGALGSGLSVAVLSLFVVVVVAVYTHPAFMPFPEHCPFLFEVTGNRFVGGSSDCVGSA